MEVVLAGEAGAIENGAAELTGQQEVRLEAVKLLGQVLRERSASFWDDPELRLTVRDDTDLILMRLTVFGTLAPAGL